MANLAAGLYDASDNLVASWETLVSTYGMDIEADQTDSVGSNAPATVLSKDALSNGVKLVIADSVTRIGVNSFAMLDTLSDVIIPDSVTSIGSGAFQDCIYLVSIVIPDGVTSIGDTTFFDCINLVSITIPVGVTSIGNRAFCLCDALTDVYYGGTEEQWQAISVGSDNAKLTGANIHYSGTTEDIEEETKTISGTWKFNDVLTVIPYEKYKLGAFTTDRKWAVTEHGADIVPITANGATVYRISFATVFGDRYVDGVPTRLYEEVAVYMDIPGVDVHYLSIDTALLASQTFTFAEEQEVSAVFYEWLTANAVEQKKVSGVWKFNDVLTNPTATIEESVGFTCSAYVESVGTVDATCSSIRVELPSAYDTPNMRYHIMQTTPDIGLPSTGSRVTAYWADGSAWNETYGGKALQTIDFGTDPQYVSADFYNWLMANAKPAKITITYDAVGILASLMDGETITLHTNGKKMEGDIHIDVAETVSTGGSECSGNHIIEVTELPTENIDESAVYLCGESYYKYQKTFTDVAIVEKVGSVVYSALNYYSSKGVACGVFTIPTKTTEGILASNLTTALYAYYIEDEDNVFVYANGTWLTVEQALNSPYNGIATELSDLTSVGHYAWMECGWAKYSAVAGTLTITEPGTYDVSAVQSAVVDIPDSAVYGAWKLNQTIEHCPSQSVRFSFTNEAGTDFVGTQIGSTGLDTELIYHTTSGTAEFAYNPCMGDPWYDENLRNIDFGAEPQMVYSKFKNWLEANATRIEETIEEYDGTITIV